MDVTTLILISFLTLLFYLFMKYRGKQLSTPPGPKGYPILGNSLDVDPKHLQLSLTELADKYGDIYKLSLFGRKVIVLNSTELVREAFLREPNASIFAGRIDSYFGKEFMFNSSDLLFSQNTEVWAKRRKFSHKLLKAYGEGLKLIEKRLHEQLNNTFLELKKMDGQVFDPEDLITNFLIGIITNLITGKNYPSDSEFSKTILEYDDVTNEMLNPLFLGIMRKFPFLKYIPGKYKERIDRFNRVQQRFYGLVEKEKDCCEGGIMKDMYQELSQIQESGSDPWLTENVVLAILSNLVQGGILTSKGAIWSMIRILISRPDVQKRMQEEVDRVVGDDRLPSLTDKSQLPYSEAVVFETLRLISHLPLAVPHVNSKDAKLGGYDIPKGSAIFLNSWKIHLDGRAYASPFDFNPERFLEEDGHMVSADSPVRQSFFAFGIGKRACIGEIFARNRIFLFLICMMQHFTFVSEDGKIPEMLDPRNMEPLAIRMPPRYRCRVIDRNKQ